MHYGVEGIYDTSSAYNVQYMGDSFEDLLSLAEDGKFKVMQYTGVKDSKNKDIYEGDILGYKDKRKKHTIIVTYNNIFCEEYGDYIGFNINTELEVIGNIYQNPELIKNDKWTN